MAQSAGFVNLLGVVINIIIVKSKVYGGVGMEDYCEYCNQGYCILQGVVCSFDEDNPCIINEMKV